MLLPEPRNYPNILRLYFDFADDKRQQLFLESVKDEAPLISSNNTQKCD